MKKPFLYILFTFLSLISLTTTAQDFTIQQADKYFARTYYAKAIPQAGKPTFEISEEDMEMGMGIHGEPGVWRGKLRTAD